MIRDICIKENETIRNALKLLDSTAKKNLLVVDDKNTLLGTLTDGDIRRFILRGESLDKTINEAYNKNPLFIFEKDLKNMDEIKKIFYEKRIELIPILDKNRKLIDYLLWDEIFKGKKEQIKGNVLLPLVIMAGGKGTRMEPFTNVLPKPLIPIGSKSILELIIDEFKSFGINEIYLTINYRGEMIRAYFEGLEKDYTVKYIKEENFFGTAGCLKLLADKINTSFIVSNCDVIVKANYEEVVRFHKENNAMLTIISAIQHHKIPYGVISFENGGAITNIIEKPEYTFTINTGVYILEKECLDYIPNNKFFNMTDLINILIKENKKIFTFPINENDYIDIGQWEEYHKAVNALKINV